MPETEDLVYRTEAIVILSEGLDKPVSERQVRRYEQRGELPVVREEMRGKQRLALYRRADVVAIREMRARQSRSKRSPDVV